MGSTLGCTDHSKMVCLRQRATISSPLSPVRAFVTVDVTAVLPGRRGTSSAEAPTGPDLDLAAGEVIGGVAELRARHVRDVLHVVAVREVEALDEERYRIPSPEPDRLLEARIQRAVGIGAEAVAGHGGVALVHEAVAVEVLEAARA